MKGITCERLPIWRCHPARLCERRFSGLKMTCELKPGIGRWLSMHKSLKVSERGEMRLQNEKMHVLTLSLSLSLSLTHSHSLSHSLSLSLTLSCAARVGSPHAH